MKQLPASGIWAISMMFIVVCGFAFCLFPTWLIRWSFLILSLIGVIYTLEQLLLTKQPLIFAVVYAVLAFCLCGMVVIVWKGMR